MNQKLFISVFAIIALAACDKAQEPPAKPAAQSKVAEKKLDATKKILTEQEIKVVQTEFNDTVEKAMSEIPPELRERHHAAFSCMVEANTKLPADQQKQIDASTIRTITARLKATPAGGNDCAAA